MGANDLLTVYDAGLRNAKRDDRSASSVRTQQEMGAAGRAGARIVAGALERRDLRAGLI
jgi:hypothetical protein